MIIGPVSQLAAPPDPPTNKLLNIEGFELTILKNSWMFINQLSIGIII